MKKMFKFLKSKVLVPFYRGAVVFIWYQNLDVLIKSSRPLLSRSGCILKRLLNRLLILKLFSSPFIEERLYFCWFSIISSYLWIVLVPFYRGAVVFTMKYSILIIISLGSRPLLSRSGCISRLSQNKKIEKKRFSSPFIEERLYLHKGENIMTTQLGSRPLLSRSGCIYLSYYDIYLIEITFSSPFIEERLYFLINIYKNIYKNVLVPFYRGAVVFVNNLYVNPIWMSSRPLLSRSGCI